MYDFERGAKTTGARFYFVIGDDAWREWSLITQMIDYHRQRGYTFVIPPYLVRRETAEVAGILPRFEGGFYETRAEGLILIPTAETPLVGMHRDEILAEADLPLKYVAFSPCFRREAGGHGARDKGLRRVHQFHKVELFVICRPEDSEVIHQEMVAQITGMIDEMFGALEYRVIELPEHDRSPVSAKTYDIEIHVGDEWLEVSSISNTHDRQSRPAQIRYRPKGGGKPVKCHLLNGSGLALPRLVLALQEREARLLSAA
jgi:seryl-tRNA synthetase